MGFNSGFKGLILKTKQYKKIWTAWHWRWRHCDVSKRQCLCVGWQHVKIRKTWIFVSAAVRTTNLAAQNTFRNSARRPDVTVCTYEVYSIGAIYPHTSFCEMVSLLVCNLRTEHPQCLPFPVFDQTVVCFFFSMCDTCVAYSIRSDLLILILYFEAHKLWNSWCNCSYPRIISLDNTQRAHARSQTHLAFKNRASYI